MRKTAGVLLAALLLALPVQGAAVPAAEESSAQEQQQTDQTPPTHRLRWILGGVLVGVSGMWMSMYRRGKK